MKKVNITFCFLTAFGLLFGQNFNGKLFSSLKTNDLDDIPHISISYSDFNNENTIHFLFDFDEYILNQFDGVNNAEILSFDGLLFSGLDLDGFNFSLTVTGNNVGHHDFTLTITRSAFCNRVNGGGFVFRGDLSVSGKSFTSYSSKAGGSVVVNDEVPYDPECDILCETFSCYGQGPYLQIENISNYYFEFFGIGNAVCEPYFYIVNSNIDEDWCPDIGLPESGKKVNEEELLFFPNPAKNKIQLNNIKGLEGTMVRIYSFDGKLRKSFSISDKLSINIEHLPTGLYLLNFIKQGNSISASFYKD